VIAVAASAGVAAAAVVAAVAVAIVAAVDFRIVPLAGPAVRPSFSAGSAQSSWIVIPISS
jgi:hypothetical protein